MDWLASWVVVISLTCIIPFTCLDYPTNTGIFFVHQTQQQTDLLQISMSAWEMSTIVIKKLSVSTLWDLITVLANLDLKAMDITASVSDLLKTSGKIENFKLLLFGI